MAKKIAIIGLDCAEPSLVFEKWKDQLPNLSKLIDQGISARLRSTDPPITIPAWSCMFSGKDPGTLGFYGFRNRKNYLYDDLYTANSDSVHELRIWDYLTKANKTSIVIGVPQTYPAKPIQGYMVSGMLAIAIDQYSVYPANLQSEIKRDIPEYQFDINNFRNLEKGELLKKIYSMTKARFKLARYLLDTRKWDSFILVEIGLDRIKHAFWQHMAEDSPAYQPSNPYKNVILKYYQYLDFEIGTLLKRFKNDTDIMIVSDHGAKTFRGGFCINQWLIEEGYLRVKSNPTKIQKLNSEEVDWSQTKIWAEGGYYSRCFINIKGREPKGIVEITDVGSLTNEIEKKLFQFAGPDGEMLMNKILYPKQIYKNVSGIPPDFMIYFDDLNYRAIGSIGWDSIITQENDTGPDGANHNYHGIFILSGNGIQSMKIDELSIYDVAPTILNRLNQSIPKDLIGTVVCN